MAEDAELNVINLNEASILASVLSDSTGDVLLTVTTALTVDDFTDPRHKTIYQALLDMNQKGVMPSIATLSSELSNTKQLDNAGGYSYLSYLTNEFTSLAPISNYISNVKDQGLLKKFVTTLKRIADDASFESISDISEFIGKAEADILTVTKERRVADVVKMDDVSTQIVEQLVKQTDEFKRLGRKMNGVTGIETGYEKLDFLTKGWHKGDMIVIGARPSVGKTAFAINLLYNVARAGIPVVFFSLEMSAVAIGMRLLENMSGLSDKQINSLEYLKNSNADQILINVKDDMENATASRLTRGMDELKKLPFYIDDTPNGRMMDITAKVKKLKNSIPDLGLVAIDYLGLITSPSKANSSSRQQEVADISRQIKQLARTVEIPIIALSQLNRETENVKKNNGTHKPQLSNLRDSGSIEQDADMIMMLYRPDYYNTTDENDAVKSQEQENNSPISQVSLLLQKNRNGSIGEVKFSFDKEHCSFTPIDDSAPEAPFAEEMPPYDGQY